MPPSILEKPVKATRVWTVSNELIKYLGKTFNPNFPISAFGTVRYMSFHLSNSILCKGIRKESENDSIQPGWFLLQLCCAC